MNDPVEREEARRELDEFETRLSALLGVVDDPRSDAEAVEHAAEAAARPFEAVRFVNSFAGAPEDERAEVRARLVRLADLSAMLREATARAMSRTADSLERTRALKAQIESVDTVDETSGLSLDCTH